MNSAYLDLYCLFFNKIYPGLAWKEINSAILFKFSLEMIYKYKRSCCV